MSQDQYNAGAGDKEEHKLSTSEVHKKIKMFITSLLMFFLTTDHKQTLHVSKY